MALRLSASELPKLLMWLDQHLPATFKLRAELKCHLRGKFPDLDFFVDRWPSPQAVTAVVDPNGQQLECRPYYRNKVLGVYSENGEAVRCLLTHCPHIDWTRTVEIKGITANIDSVLKPLSQENCNVQVRRYVLLEATRKDSKPVPVPCGMKISPITEATVDIVDSTWKLHDAHSKSYIRYLSRHFPSVAMTTACGQHVGHAQGYNYGVVGLIYVMPQFRGQGYAKAIVSQLTQKYFSAGEDAFSIVAEDNFISLDLHRSLGWKPVHGLFACCVCEAQYPY